MADFNNLRDQAKQWLSSMFMPKDVSSEGLNNTGIGQLSGVANAALQPGLAPAMYALSKLLDTKVGKQVTSMMDATGPGAGGVDDIVSAGAKSLPASLAVVAPMFSDLGRMKPRGVPAKPSEYFHSNLAEAIDQKFIAPGKPDDLLSVKEVKAWLSRLPGMGVKKEEIHNFQLPKYLSEEFLGPESKGKITRKDLAEIIDLGMPRIETEMNSSDYIDGNGFEIDGHPASRFNNYTLPGGRNYKNHVIHSPMSGVRPVDTDIPGEPYPYPVDSPFQDIPGNTIAAEKGHFYEDNVLQSIRTTDRTLPDGRNALYTEEVQSDWAQDYPNDYPLSSNYEDLAHKYLYRQAADRGLDSVAWAPGSVHIDRWSGEKKLDKVEPRLIEEPRLLPEDHPLRIEFNEKATPIDNEIQELDYKIQQAAENPENIGTGEFNDLVSKRNDLYQKYDDVRNTYEVLTGQLGLIDGEYRTPGRDVRFSGNEAFYNKRMVDSAKGMLKRMGGGGVKETDLAEITEKLPQDTMRHIVGLNAQGGPRYDREIPLPKYITEEPINLVLGKYEAAHPPSEGYVQPAPNKSFVYDIRPEDKLRPSRQEQLRRETDPDKRKELRRLLMEEGDTDPNWRPPLAGKTVPLWMLLGGLGFNQLRGRASNEPE